MILGLTTPSSGHAWVAGRHYRTLVHPLRTVGAVLDGGALCFEQTREHGAVG